MSLGAARKLPVVGGRLAEVAREAGEVGSA